ncbi:C-terminal helicase domain-containing protein [Desulfurivibrio alkaliphilus]|uniref:helicase-related protein n=1 Tax=Desulfurivibrio alkaliphilus TaxID=427923 RepID=UPI0005A2A456|nr:C-terminal helicase domain-containing protein [Desulfurivibrio alkaliphilus]
MIYATDTKAEDVLDIPDVNYINLEYELQWKHARYYQELVEELLVVFDSGQVIDAVTQQALYQRAQRMILSVPDPKIVPAGLDMLNQVIEETGVERLHDEKLLVYVNYRDSNDAVKAHLDKLKIGCIQIYGGATDNHKRVEQFRDDPAIKVAITQPKSGGAGLNLQFCRYMMFLELPITSSDFEQCVGRIKRSGQDRKCTVWPSCAIGTIQESIRERLLNKEDLLQTVFPTRETLRKALTGRLR